MSNAIPNQEAQQKLFYAARLLASQEDYRAPRDMQRVSLAKLDSLLSGMEFSERVFIKEQFFRAGLIVENGK